MQALQDHEVRLRMQRGQVAAGRLELWRWHPDLADIPATPQNAEGQPLTDVELDDITRFIDQGADIGPDQVGCWFQLALRNTGEVTIREFLLEVSIAPSLPDIHVVIGSTVVGVQVPWIQRFESEKGQRIFPGDRIRFPDSVWTVAMKRNVNNSSPSVSLKWQLFLDAAPRSSGTLDVLSGMRCHSPSDDK
jgi:hypothetical protein